MFGLVLFIGTLLITEAKGAQNLTSCYLSGVKYKDKCIWTNSSSTGLIPALKECSYFGGKLLHFDNFIELDTVYGYIGLGTIPVLLGVKRIQFSSTNATYFWLDDQGKTTDEVFFAPFTDVIGSAEQGKDCLRINGSNLTATDCDAQSRYICEYTCAVAGVPKCVYLGTVINHILNKTLNNSMSTGNDNKTLPIDVPRNIISEIIHHDNITQASTTEITEYITVVHDTVVNSNQTISLNAAMEALLKLSELPSVSEENYLLYVESMSRIITITSSPEINTPPEQSSNILVAMENMMCAAVIDESDIFMEEFDIQIRTIRNATHSSYFSFEYFDGDEEIFLDSGVLSSDEGRISTIIYNDLATRLSRSFKDNREIDITSHVISIAVQSKHGNQTFREKINQSNAVNFTLRLVKNENETSEGKRICSFWNIERRFWSDDGCRLLYKNDTHTTCNCEHLTSFAVLVMYYTEEENEMSSLNKRILYIVSSVGCSLSIFGLSMTIFVYIYFRILKKERIFIHANLSLSLLLGQLVFVVTNETHESPMICKLVAILLHFFFLSAFTWMLVEGLSLYFTTVNLSNPNINPQGDTRVKYLLIGWGAPVVVVLISFGSEFQNYGDGPGDSCWLSLKNGLIWSFMGPMLLIVMFNILILGLVLKVFLTLKSNQQRSEAARLRASLRAMVMLLPLLGMTWILSLLVPFSSWFQYLFVIGNSLQGMLIFFLHCLCNEQVRNTYRRRSSAFRTTDTDLSIVGRRKSHVDGMPGYKQDCRNSISSCQAHPLTAGTSKAL